MSQAMEAVNAFDSQLLSLYESETPLSRAKLARITESAIRSVEFCDHVVQKVEKFICESPANYKVSGLFVVDSIVHQSRHQFGVEKDVFTPCFSENIIATFQNLVTCSKDDWKEIRQVLHIWQQNNIFSPEIMQQLFSMTEQSDDGGSMAASSAAATSADESQHSEPSDGEEEARSSFPAAMESTTDSAADRTKARSFTEVGDKASADASQSMPGSGAEAGTNVPRDLLTSVVPLLQSSQQQTGRELDSVSTSLAIEELSHDKDSRKQASLGQVEGLVMLPSDDPPDYQESEASPTEYDIRPATTHQHGSDVDEQSNQSSVNQLEPRDDVEEAEVQPQDNVICVEEEDDDVEEMGAEFTGAVECQVDKSEEEYSQGFPEEGEDIDDDEGSIADNRARPDEQHQEDENNQNLGRNHLREQDNRKRHRSRSRSEERSREEERSKQDHDRCIPPLMENYLYVARKECAEVKVGVSGSETDTTTTTTNICTVEEISQRSLPPSMPASPSFMLPQDDPPMKRMPPQLMHGIMPRSDGYILPPATRNIDDMTVQTSQMRVRDIVFGELPDSCRRLRDIITFSSWKVIRGDIVQRCSTRLRNRRPVSSACPKRELTTQLTNLLSNTRTLHQEIKQMKECNDTSDSTRLKISEKRQVLQDTLKACSRRNKEIYGTTSKNSAENELKYLNVVELMLGVPALKGFEPAYKPLNPMRPLSDTAELVYFTAREMGNIANTIEDLRCFITASEDQSGRQETGARLITRLEVTSRDKLPHNQIFVDKRASHALKAFLLPPSQFRMTELEEFDRSMAVKWREHASKLEKACAQMIGFIRKNASLRQ